MSYRLAIFIFIAFSFSGTWDIALSQASRLPRFNPEKSATTDLRPTDVIHWQAQQAHPSADGLIEAKLQLSTSQGFTIYKNKLEFAPPPGMVITKIDPPDAYEITDPVSGQPTFVYRTGVFVIYLSGIFDIDATDISIRATYTGCTELLCLFPYTETISVPYLSSAEADDIAAASLEILDEPRERVRLQTRLADVFGDDDQVSLALLIFAVFIGGLITNLTPCVYPMIPITLRILGSNNMNPFLNSSLYASGILATYTGLGLFAALSGGMFGEFMANSYVNLAFAMVMLLLGLSMLGFGNFSKLQQVGSRLGSGKPSLRNMFLMGTGAGLVAAPCTGPVLAALLAYTAQTQDTVLGASLLFMYSFGFALPYVALGGAAAKVSAYKVGPTLQLLVKVLFAAAMFALAFYYLRIPAYSTLQAMRPHFASIALSGLIAGGVLVTIWLALPRLQHNKYLTVIPSAILGIGIFGASQWVVSGGGATPLIQWHASEQAGFASASDSQKLIFIDNWAEWCEACKVMDVTTFRDERVVEELSTYWEPIKLDLTESNSTNDEIIDRYSLPGLPTLILLPADAALEGMERIVGEQSASELLEKLRAFRSQRT